MNHDATHCLDYGKNKCPKSCYRAQLTDDLRNILYELPTSWAHLRGTRECPLPKEERKDSIEMKSDMEKNCVMISLHPRWCAEIAQGWKDLEVRKTVPQAITRPFKAYIYCTRLATANYWIGKKGPYVSSRAHSVEDICGAGRVIGEFICDAAYPYTTRTGEAYESAIGTEELLRRSCLTWRELIEYESGGGVRQLDLDKRKGVWAWQISQLKLYQKPLFLEQLGMKQPPQSWCYVTDRGEI